MGSFRCRHCDLVFPMNEDDPRCPECLRRSSVEPHHAPEKKASILKTLSLLCAIALGAGLWFLWPDHEEHAPSKHTEAPKESAQRLPAEEGDRWRALVDQASTRRLAAMLEGESTDESVRRASAILSAALAQGTLFLIEDEVLRPPLSPELMKDTLVTGLLERENVLLHPSETSFIIAAALTRAGVPFEVSLLDEKEPQSNKLPLPTIIIHGRERFALNPRTGNLERTTEETTNLGIALLWADFYRRSARHSIELGALDEARANYERALSLTPELWTARVEAIELEMMEEDQARAMRLGASLLEAPPDHPRAWWIAAQLKTSAPEEQNQALEELLFAFPGEAVLCVELGRRRLLEDPRGARRAFEEALARASQVEGAHAGLAELLLTSDPELAYSHLRQELLIHPNSSHAQLLLALYWRLRGDSSRERLALDQAKRLSTREKDVMIAFQELADRADVNKKE